tara:strand:- start:560 stop:1084 length:525 start_codon:yes stop_codon:yes gene_type:complete
MTDYSKACVYKLVCKDSDVKDIYIGSTKNFKNRMKGHKCNCNNIKRSGYNFKVYKCIRDNGGWDNWQMIKICDVKCLDKYDLCKKEGEYIRSLKPTLNQKIAGRSPEDSSKASRLKNKDKIKAYRLKNKDKKKAYDFKNRDKINERRAKNRDKINKQARERYAKKKATQSSSQV